MTILRDLLSHQGFIIRNTGSTDLELIDAMESQAVSKSSPELAMVLGKIWGEGITVPVDEESSMGWYLFAADLGDRDAQVNCGFSYREGRGVDRDIVKAVKWFTKAANAGDPEAQCELAKFAMTSGHDWQLNEEDDADVEREFELHWTREEHYGFIAMLRQSAEQGFAEAQACLGWNFEKGFFEEMNIESALHWYEKAARQGDLNAKSALKRLGRESATGLSTADEGSEERTFRRKREVPVKTLFVQINV
jgi:TPR repeat protein